MLFLDLAKAFDTVDHALLIKKLKCLGFRYGTTMWFESYLSDRQQLTVVEGHSSSLRHMNCGVPQGSILGPLLFICYVKDLQRHCLYSMPCVYADDTALLCTGDNPEIVEGMLQHDLNVLSKWFVVNKLSVNVGKTKAMLFTSNRSKYKHYELSVSLCNENVKHVYSMKYLGLILDPHLTFSLHINKLCGKLNSRSKLLWQIRGFIDFNLAKMLYLSLIQPHILYCNFVLDGATMTEKGKLQIQQNTALRAVCKADYAFSTAKLLSAVGVDSVQTCMKKTTCKIVHKGLYNLGPPALNDMFNHYEPARQRRSSTACLVDIPHCQTQFGMKNIAVRGAKYSNMLPLEIKTCPVTDNFKAMIKKYPGFD